MGGNPKTRHKRLGSNGIGLECDQDFFHKLDLGVDLDSVAAKRPSVGKMERCRSECLASGRL